MLIYIVIAPVIIGVFLFLTHSNKAGRYIAVAAQTALVGYSVHLFILSRDGEITERVGGYESAMGVSLRVDALSAAFLMLTAFIFLIVSIYTLGERYDRLFWFQLYIWQGLLSGIFLTRDLFNYFIMVEVATVTVSVLIMFKRDRRSMYDGMTYLLVNTVAIQFYLFGAGYIYKIAGSFDIDTVALALAGAPKESLILPFALIMTSLSLKCAVTPLFGWLPRAHGSPGAPPVVSAILSGLHIKGGLYFFIRVSGMFSSVDAGAFFFAAGIVTCFAGLIFAVTQTDLKLILAYHTISTTGMILAGLNAGSAYALTGSVYHILSHALFKSALFLCVGVIYEVYGTCDLREVRGVFKRLPVVGVAVILAILGNTGAPFFNGSISKYFIMYDASPALSALYILISLGTIISYIRFAAILFNRKTGGRDAALKPAGRFKLSSGVSVLVLGLACLAGGLFGEDAIMLLFQTPVSVDPAGYLQKSVIYIACVAAGFVIYNYVIKRSGFFRRVREADLGFRGACAAIGAYFAILLVVTGIMN